MIEKRLQEIAARKVEIRFLLETDEEVSLEAIETELRALDDEKAQLEKRQATASAIQSGAVEAQKIIKPQEVRSMELTIDAPEYRSAYLKMLQGKRLSDVEERALTTGSGATAAVPTQTLNQIIDKLRQTSVLYSRVSVTNIPEKVDLVVANAKNASAWKAEGTNGTAADDTVSSVSLSGYELIKLVEISAAASAMTIDAFEAYLSAEIGRQMGIAIENAILNGSGSGSNQPTGILTGVTFNAGNSTTWALNASVGYDNLVDGLALLPTAYHNNAVFVMNRAMLFGGIRKIKETTGNPLFTYNPQDRAAGTILGYPVILDDYAPANTILLGDLSYYYLNMVQAPAIDVSREAAFVSGKLMYRGLAILDGKPALDEAFVRISRSLT